MAFDKWEAAAAVGITGWGVWSLHSAYTATAPSLGDVRDSDSTTSANNLQKLVDADVTVGSLAIISGGFASILMHSWLPIVLVSLAFGVLSLYYHHAYNGTPVDVPTNS